MMTSDYDDEMPATPAERQRAYRDRLRGGPPREPKPHGTRAAALRHARAHEDKCEPCAEVWAAHQNVMYLKRRHRAGKASATAVRNAERAVRRMEREAVNLSRQAPT